MMNETGISLPFFDWYTKGRIAIEIFLTNRKDDMDAGKKIKLKIFMSKESLYY